MTDRAVVMMIKKLEAMSMGGHDISAVLDQSVLNCWQDVFPLRQSSSFSQAKNNVAAGYVPPKQDPVLLEKRRALQRQAELDNQNPEAIR